MEIDITRFFEECAPRDYSASVAEIGQDAGAVTWAAACEDAPEFALLDTPEKRDAFRDYVRGFGAWTDAELSGWTDTELGALFLQLIAGDIREAGLDTAAPDWAEYEAGAQAGRYSGNLYRGDAGRVYYYVGA